MGHTWKKSSQLEKYLNKHPGRNTGGGRDFPAFSLNRRPRGETKKQVARNSDKHGYL